MAIYGERFVQYDEKSGRPYVDRLVRKVDGTVVTRRRYGDLVDCLECGGTFLKVNKGSDGYCSRSCGRKGKPAPRKKESKSALKLKCDKLFSIAVREVGSCERCGASFYPDLQCAHVVSRKYLGVRWDRDNAFCLCKGCHYWGHANPLEWDEFVESKLGADGYADIKRRARAFTTGTKKMTLDSYRVLLERMEVLVEEATGEERPDSFVQYTYRQSERVKAQK
jgi:hypothetical protein